MGRKKVQTADSAVETPAVRFLRSARACRTRDLERLVVLGELVRHISALIHALQKERGAASIFLGSNGSQFTERLAARIAECRDLESLVRERLEHIDQTLDRMSSGARFYTRVGLAFRALDTLDSTRDQIASLIMAPQDAVKAFTEVIARLLAIGFEVADIAADPAISRALVALVNFVQGKEYAGQERATAGGSFSRGSFHATDRRRLQHLVAAQQQAFRHFEEFADRPHIAAFHQIIAGRDSAEVKRMREIALGDDGPGELPSATADAWYEHTTRRIDAMRSVEDRMAKDLGLLCAAKLAEASNDSGRPEEDRDGAIITTAPVAMLVMDLDPARDHHGMEDGVDLYTLDGALPKPMRSILDVIQAQSRRIEVVSSQLESARVALAERKIIEHAKGLLMKSRRLSEKDAYTLIRETAMKQNKRIFEVAEAIVSMADILKT